MRPSARELALSLAVAASLSALALGGGPDGVLATLALVPAALPGGLAARVPSWVGTLGRVLGALVVAVGVALGWPVEALVGTCLVLLLLHQRALSRGRSSPRSALLLTVLLLVATAARTTSPVFLPIWAVWTGAAAAALGDAGSGRSRGLVGGVVTLVALLVFPLVPRPGGAAATPEDDAVAGFSEDVSLGDFSRLRDDPAEVARVRFPDGDARPVALRAAALTRFDGRAWTNTSALRPEPLGAAGPTTRVAVEHVDLGGTLLVPGRVARLEGVEASEDVGDGWRRLGGGPVSYTADVVLDAPVGPAALRDDERRRNLQLPAGLDPRVRALALSLDVGNPDDTVRAVLGHLASNHRYTRVDVRGGEDPLAAFLFDRRAGHCELFATATAVLLRASDIPARVVTGFVGGERTGDGQVFRRSHAHAWVEVHRPGRGWLAVDATRGVRRAGAAAGLAQGLPDLPRVAWTPPPLGQRLEAAWSRWVVELDGADQAAAVAVALEGSWWWGPLLLLAGGALLLSRWRPRRRSDGRPQARARRQGVVGAWDEALEALARRGIRPPRDLPPLAAADWVATEVVSVAQPIRRLAWLHAEVRFGGADPEPRLAEARALAAAIRQGTRKGTADA